jgi:hypothetical protein
MMAQFSGCATATKIAGANQNAESDIMVFGVLVDLTICNWKTGFPSYGDKIGNQKLDQCIRDRQSGNANAVRVPAAENTPKGTSNEQPLQTPQ